MYGSLIKYNINFKCLKTYLSKIVNNNILFCFYRFTVVQWCFFLNMKSTEELFLFSCIRGL